MAGLFCEEDATKMIDGQTLSMISGPANLAAAMFALTLGLLLIPAGALRLRNP
jgi:hypothetical protein